MWISRYFVEFILFSFLGWIWETVYCTIFNGKWESRGFLFGPVCPIYGVGAVSGIALVDVLKLLNLPPLLWWQVVIIFFFGSAVLEYSTSVVLERLFHAYWWDYSKMPLNINGRICLPASLAFAAAGLLVIYVLYPFCDYISSFVSPICFEILAFVLLIIFTVDMTLTISALTGFEKKISKIDDNINEHMSEFVDNLYQSTNSLSRRTLARIKGVKYTKPTQTKIYLKLMEKIKK